jgi:phage terminase large subunit-like protein
MAGSTVTAPQAKRGRPPLSEAEKVRRGTLHPVRVRQAIRAASPADPPVSVPAPAAVRDYTRIASRYVQGVIAGRILASTWVRLACERHVADLATYATRGPYVWSAKHAREACAFLEQLPHTEGRWATPTIRLEPWQLFLVTSLFGWRVRADPARRRFTVLYLELGRKGAKSTLMAAIALFHLLREGEPGPCIVCGATTGSQARIVFGIAQRMVFASPWLKAQGVQAFANSIVTTDGVIKPINAKASTQDGLNPSCIVLDESHAQTFELHDVLKSSQGARHNPLLLCPTTAGYNQLSVGYALRTTLIKVLQGVVVADHLLGAIYTLDAEDDWRDERVWPKANPMLGITPTREWMRRYCADAQQTPGLEAEFRVKCCSEWFNAAATWLSMAAWDRCADPTLRLETFAGQPCWIGADLAQLDDLAAVALVFQDGDRLVGFVRCYLPEHVVQERARAVPEYRLWAEGGQLVLTEGSMIDYSRIERDIRGWCAQFQVRDICFDQFGSVQITGNLFNDGFPARMEQKNAKTFTPPTRELEARVRHGRFRHDGNTCLRWQASNVVVSRRIDDSLLPKKEGPESPHKIDAIDALLLAMGGVLRSAGGAPPKRYQVFVFGGAP